jgi:hypothetical protein
LEKLHIEIERVAERMCLCWICNNFFLIVTLIGSSGELCMLTFNIGIPTSLSHLFSGWANDLEYRVKKFFLTEASTICWALWISRNKMVFDKSPLKTYIQVLYRGIY